MSYFLKKGNTFRLTPKDSLHVEESLPLGTYTIKQDQSRELFLETIESFEIKGKLYGNVTSNADRILRTFMDRNTSTGVLLSGIKGSGKTLLSKVISVEGARQGIPTIVVNSSLSGESFNTFVQMIKQPTIFLFDEFEKVYQRNMSQEQMLTLLDGVYPSKKLFLFTTNNRQRMNINMLNRPGRIYYLLDFDSPDEAFVREYCKDNLKATEHIEKVVGISGFFTTFNFDLLKAMVEEMNRYNETPAEVLRFLNARPEVAASAKYTAVVEIAGEEDLVVSDSWSGDPIKDTLTITYTSADGSQRSEAKFSPTHLQTIDVRNGIYVLENPEAGAKVVLTRVSKAVTVDLDTLCSLVTTIEKETGGKETNGRKRKSNGDPVQKEEKVSS